MKRIIFCFTSIFIVSFFSIAYSSVKDDWKSNCQVVNDYSTKLSFTVMLQEPRGTGVNRNELLNLFARFTLDSDPQIKKKYDEIIKMIYKAESFNPGYGNANMTMSKKMSNNIDNFFSDIKARAKKEGVECGRE